MWVVALTLALGLNMSPLCSAAATCRTNSFLIPSSNNCFGSIWNGTSLHLTHVTLKQVNRSFCCHTKSRFDTDYSSFKNIRWKFSWNILISDHVFHESKPRSFLRIPISAKLCNLACYVCNRHCRLSIFYFPMGLSCINSKCQKLVIGIGK